MSSLNRVLGSSAALVGALLAFACQKDGNALFDNSNVGEPVAGSGGASSSGAQGGSGTGNTGASSATGGSASEAGEGTGAMSGGGTGGGGEASEGGSGGSAGSAAGSGGKGEEGGTAGSATAGSGGGGSGGGGGTKPDPEPEPVTIAITAFVDAEVRSCNQFENYGSLEVLDVDADSSNCVHQALLRATLDQIPEGALVSAATLTLTCTDLGGLVDVLYVQEAWVETSVRWNNRPEADEDTSIGTLLCDEAHGLGPITLDLKAPVVAWLAGDRENYGIYLQTESDSGTGFASSENDEESARPVLSVTYTLPVK